MSGDAAARALVARGYAKWKRGERRECLQDAEAALELAPGLADAEALLALAMCQDLRHTERAMALTQSALKRDPGSAFAWAVLAFMQMADMPTGRASAAKAVALDPGCSLGQLVGAFLDEDGTPEARIARTTKIIALDPELPAALLHRANARAGLRDPEWRRDVEAALAMAPSDPFLLVFASVLHEEVGEAGAALALLDRALALDPECLHALNRRSSLRCRMKRYVEAEEDATRLIAFMPELSSPWTQRAEARAGVADYERSLSDAARALAIGPENAFAFALAGLARTQITGDARRARAAMRRALELDPGPAIGDQLRAWLATHPPEADPPEPEPAEKLNAASRAAFDAHRYDEVVRLQTLLILDEPAYGPSWSIRGAAHELLGHDEQALRDAEQSYDLSRSTDALAFRMHMRERRARFEAALEDAITLTQAAPRDPDALNARARLRFRLGDFSGAAADAGAEIALTPWRGLSWYTLGTALAELGDGAGARSVFERALALGLDGGFASRTRGWLDAHPR